jgi:hypothetical protein
MFCDEQHCRHRGQCFRHRRFEFIVTSASQNRTPNLTSHINTAFSASSSVFPGHAVAMIVERHVSKSAANPTLSLNYAGSYAKLRRIWRDDFVWVIRSVHE